ILAVHDQHGDRLAECGARSSLLSVARCDRDGPRHAADPGPEIPETTQGRRCQLDLPSLLRGQPAFGCHLRDVGVRAGPLDAGALNLVCRLLLEKKKNCLDEGGILVKQTLKAADACSSGLEVQEDGVRWDVCVSATVSD